MTQLTKEQVKHHATLAWLAITDDEAEAYVTELSGIVDFVKELQEADTDGVEPMTHPLQVFNVLRKDVPTDILDREEMLKSVKQHEDGQIKVPTIL
ncbi:Asp-tRNA(Asn)/Glu-tRNA(Gln) amidotransferase subunit GatC [Sporosarcina sp. YIM B06819]|uniref:Asp-tRNA(Asn)/Glu-tRNA(Gln) amidotransferase subunit GatC n=1 Tax=Sporosarcina sp. YIM B06819 TaxID=3081769 RepID=UPI00298D1C18|nr:Asp-tRNA(Asn)/Glu-tRNA(Gln) amidotransferase subunit GatC [Sporosarcina sp. YIM B06819]